MSAGMIGGRMCGMRARRVGHRQTLETAVRGIGARHFRGSADKSYRRGVMRIQYTALPAISPTLSLAGQKKTMGATPEGRYGSSTTKARRDDATTSDATCGVSLPRQIAANHNQQPSSPGFSAEQDEANEAARSTPGNPSTLYKRDVDVLPRLC